MNVQFPQKHKFNKLALLLCCNQSFGSCNRGVKQLNWFAFVFISIIKIKQAFSKKKTRLVLTFVASLPVQY